MKPYNSFWNFECDASIISVAGTLNLSTIVAGTVGKSVYLLNGEGNTLWDAPITVDNEVWATSISEDGQLIAVGTANKNPVDGTLYVFNREGKQVWSTRVRFPVWNIKLSSDAKMLAATTWNNQVLLFEKNETGYQKVSVVDIPVIEGLYGCEFMEDRREIAVVSYDAGLYFVNYKGEITKTIPLEEGLYNISYASDAGKLFVGRRNGSFVMIDLNKECKLTEKPSISQRPVCGISSTENGLILACGSFDSRVIISNSSGDIIWDFRTKGEVWSTAISASGSKIVVGCGDHYLRAFTNICNVEAYKEIAALERSIENPDLIGGELILDNLIGLYRKYKIIEYGYNKINKLFRKRPVLYMYRDKLKNLLCTPSHSLDDSITHLNLGTVLFEEKKYDDAIKHFQIAAINPLHRSIAQRKASECFYELGLKTASTSADRQSREQHLDYEARHVLFMLARDYEDRGQWKKASKLYEMLLSWDVEFRNARNKLKIAQAYSNRSPQDDLVLDKDYTGTTTSFLGPDTPTNVDSKLANVIKARSKEVLIRPGDIAAVQVITKDLLADKSYSRGIKKDIALLDYDQQLFLKYDYGLPQDEMKKFLETVNASEFFSHARKLSKEPISLDVGSATGRYPSLLTRLGFKAHGIDIEEAAILYANEKKNAGEEWPKYTCGDATNLDQYFDATLQFHLITCMMGTFEHIPKSEQAELIAKLHDRLQPGGACVISVWDTECPHLAYLSIYDEGQKELIRENSCTQKEMTDMFRNAGFENTSIVPFALLPHTFIYDLGIERFQDEDVEIATQADLAARALFKNRNGEMFLIVGFKK